MFSGGGKVKGPGPKPKPAELKALKKEQARRESGSGLKHKLQSLVSNLRAAGRTDAQILAVVNDANLDVTHGVKKDEFKAMLKDVMGKDSYAVAVAELKAPKAEAKPHPMFHPKKVAVDDEE